MSRNAFADRCQTVCESQSWELLPTGILVKWGDGRRQLVRLEFFEAGRQPLVRLTSAIGEADRLERERLVLALRTNAELAHGALAISGKLLCMTDTLMLDSAEAQIESAIEYLATRADEYERALFGTDDH